MPKINRRDYLIRMGAAAGAMASLPAVSVLGQPENSAHVDVANSGAAPSPQTNLLRWVPTATPPNLDAFVTAIFWGLMGFCYKTPTTQAGPPPAVEVGVHPGGNHHNFTITVVKILGSTPTVICTERRPRITSMRLRVISQASAPPPKVFQKEPFDRVTGGDPLDFRWLPDLDGVDLYPEPYEKNRHFGPRLFVENGVFYTRMPTNSRFKLVRAQDHTSELREFGHVARFTAAAIEVQNANDYVSFEINGVERCRLVKENNIKYQIIFKNECNHSSCPGPSTINDPDETKRNHFHFMRKVLDLPRDRIKYALEISPPARQGAELNFFNPDTDKEARATDEAPCAGAAFGQANGFPT
jgi:hypothetical protein